jgi:hypothetical protein
MIVALGLFYIVVGLDGLLILDTRFFLIFSSALTHSAYSDL